MGAINKLWFARQVNKNADNTRIPVRYHAVLNKAEKFLHNTMLKIVKIDRNYKLSEQEKQKKFNELIPENNEKSKNSN